MKIFSLRDGFIEKELKRLGHEVVEYNYKKKLPTRPELKKFYGAFADSKPDIFWFQKDPQLTPQVMAALRRVSPKTRFVMWWGDQRGGQLPPLIRARTKVLAALFMTNGDPSQVVLFKKAGIPQVRTFYHAFSPTEFQDFPTPITHQVFFGGNRFKPNKFPLVRLRTQLILEVHSRFRLIVFGHNWPFPTEKTVLRPEYARVLRRANMNLGINHYDIRRYYNRRLWECMASGRLHLTYYVPGMEADFENRKHLIWFRSVSEAIGQIQYFLDHPDERERIARAGREFVLANHSWTQRTPELVRLFEGVL